jgi:hypothetical protein
MSMKMEMRNQNSNQEGKRGVKVFLSLLAILAMSSEAATHAAARVDVPKVYITCVAEALKRHNDCLREVDVFEDYEDFLIFSNVCYDDYGADLRACALFRPSKGSPTPQISE